MSSEDSQEIKSPLRNPTIHITTHNDEGKAIVKSHQNEAKSLGSQRATINVAYTTSSFPADLNDEQDIKQHEDLIASGKLGLVNGGIV